MEESDLEWIGITQNPWFIYKIAHCGLFYELGQVIDIMQYFHGQDIVLYFEFGRPNYEPELKNGTKHTVRLNWFLTCLFKASKIKSFNNLSISCLKWLDYFVYKN